MLHFTIVYPTSNRPKILAEALEFLKLQRYPNFKVVILDNPSSDGFACDFILDSHYPFQVIYDKAESFLSMTDNWNRGIKHCSGDFVIYMSDRSFLLPHALDTLNHELGQSNIKLFNMHYAAYYPLSIESPFADGYLIDNIFSASGLDLFFSDSWGEERLKFRYACGTIEPWLHNRGMIYLGGFHSSVIDLFLKNFGSVFHGISPDYTSMYLTFNHTFLGASIRSPLVLLFNNNLSNGKSGKVNPAAGINFISQYTIGERDQFYRNMLVPDVLTTHNSLYADYYSLKNKFDLEKDIHKFNALSLIDDDITNFDDIETFSCVIESYKRNMSLYIGTLTKEQRDLFCESKGKRMILIKRTTELRQTRILSYQKISFSEIRQVANYVLEKKTIGLTS